MPGGLQHDRRDRADKHRLGDPAGRAARDIADDLAAAGRMTDVDGVLQIERLGQRRHVGGVGVHFISGIGLIGTAVTAAVVRDDAIALLRKEEHLIVPVVRA
ncbi:hypothetical protein D9M72_630550 [compost metagenome]